MTDPNILSLAELKTLKAQVDKALNDFEGRMKHETLNELEVVARKHGFKLTELTGIQLPKTRSPAKAKYANPKDQSNTWSGRGRTPKWFKEALKEGKSLDQLAVKPKRPSTKSA